MHPYPLKKVCVAEKAGGGAKRRGAKGTGGKEQGNYPKTLCRIHELL